VRNNGGCNVLLAVRYFGREGVGQGERDNEVV
jgi:hypothetical protein